MVEEEGAAEVRGAPASKPRRVKAAQTARRHSAQVRGAREEAKVREVSRRLVVAERT